ncbi:MAG: aldehyde dehydrogenase [Bacillaceae bacterium]
MKSLFTSQKAYFYSGVTKEYAFRMTMLNRLKEAIKKNEAQITAAIRKDLHKSEFDCYATEIGIVYDEINHVKKKLRKWMKPKRVGTPIQLIGSKSYLYHEPYGVSLIIAPWNYPFQLMIAPLIGAIAGGNTAILKPSELTPNVSAIIKKLIESIFEKEYVAVVEGGVEETTTLLSFPFDKIFFTGSVPVGKIVMEAASKHLTPVTLELGGKSPVIVMDDANIELTAKRIVWGKFLNAGQTCIAPDYLLVHHRVKEKLINRMKEMIEAFYSNNPLDNENYTHIVNERQFNRLLSYLNNAQIIFGGKHRKSDLVIEPTLIENISWDSPVMQDEIFGPILPIFTFEHLDEVIMHVRRYEKPLALYLFTSSKEKEQEIIEKLPFGGGTINDAILHLTNGNLPFGGVGASGMGSYHGHYSFKAFTHEKAVLKQTTVFDLFVRYPNYKHGLKVMKQIFK